MLQNFRAIMKYNPAEAYALAIGHLADRLRGGGPFVQAWPRDERVLSRAERLELQQQLARRGFDVGEPDGRLGAKTRAAMRDFQARSGPYPGRIRERRTAPAVPGGGDWAYPSLKREGRSGAKRMARGAPPQCALVVND